MPLVYSIRGKEPKFGQNCFIAENATIVGDVECGDDCTFWYQSVVRGDVNRIEIGNKVNVQDGVVIHCTYQKTKTKIGNNVSIGHRAIVHGCTIADNVLIGMGSIIMDNAVIGTGSIIAAGAVVLENTIVEPMSIYAGVPAKKVKDVSRETKENFVDKTADAYVKYASWLKER